MPFSLIAATLSGVASALSGPPAVNQAGAGDEADFAPILEEARKTLASEVELGLVAQTLPLVGMLSPDTAQVIPISQAVQEGKEASQTAVQVPLTFAIAEPGEEMALHLAHGAEAQPNVPVQQGALADGVAVNPEATPGEIAAATPTSASEPAPPSSLRLVAFDPGLSPPEESQRLELHLSPPVSAPLADNLSHNQPALKASPAVKGQSNGAPANEPKTVSQSSPLSDIPLAEVTQSETTHKSLRSRLALTGGEIASPQRDMGVRGGELPALEPGSGLNSAAAKVLPHIVQGIEALERSSQTSLRLHLHSEDLGRVEVWLTSNPQGVHIALHAEAAQTGELLQRHLPQLRQSLAQAGVHLAGLNVEAGGAQGQHSRTDLERHHPWGGASAGAERRARLSAEPASRPIVYATSAIDYRI